MVKSLYLACISFHSWGRQINAETKFKGTQESGNPGCSGSSQMVPIARMTVFAKQGINFNHRNLASPTIQLDVAIQHWELLVLDLILSGLRIPVTNRKVFLKPSHAVALGFLICFQPGNLGPSMCFAAAAVSSYGRQTSALVLLNFIFFYFVLSFLLIYFFIPKLCMYTVGGMGRGWGEKIRVIRKILTVLCLPFKSNHFLQLVLILLEDAVEGEIYRGRENFICISKVLGIVPE